MRALWLRNDLLRLNRRRHTSHCGPSSRLKTGALRGFLFLFSSFSLILRSDDDIRVNLFCFSVCVSRSLLVRPATACSLFNSAWHIAFKRQRQVRPSATRTSLKLGLESRPASSGRLARLVEALGAIRSACTDRHKVAPPRRHRSCRAERSGSPRSTTRCHSASCRTLGTLAHYSYTQLLHNM